MSKKIFFKEDITKLFGGASSVLGVMKEEAQRMTRLVDELLSLNHIENNSHLRPTETVNLIQILDQTIPHRSPHPQGGPPNMTPVNLGPGASLPPQLSLPNRRGGHQPGMPQAWPGKLWFIYMFLFYV